MQREIYSTWQGETYPSTGQVLADGFGYIRRWNDLARALMGIEAAATWLWTGGGAIYSEKCVYWPDAGKPIHHACLLPVLAIESFGRAVEDASAGERVQFSGTRGHHAVAIDAEGRIQPWRSVGTWNPISLNDRCVFCGGDHARGIDCPSFESYQSPRPFPGGDAFRDALKCSIDDVNREVERVFRAWNDEALTKAFPLTFDRYPCDYCGWSVGDDDHVCHALVRALAHSWGRSDDLAHEEAKRHVAPAVASLRTELRRLDPWLSGGVTSGDASGLFVQRAKGAENA